MKGFLIVRVMLDYPNTVTNKEAAGILIEGTERGVNNSPIKGYTAQVMSVEDEDGNELKEGGQ